ncbi:MAG: RsmE family RNA methyltransferase [Spirochaetota bacterium]
MNMLILDESEPGRPLPKSDRRVRHILRILKKQTGDEVLAVIADDGQGPLAGQVGMAHLDSWDGQHLVLSFRPDRPSPPLHPLTILLGFPRPIQANRILKDLASLGVARIILSGTELGEKSYFQSDFFKNREFRTALVEGAEQAANPRLPRVETSWTITKALQLIDPAPHAGESGLWALDPYRSEGPFGMAHLASPLVLAIGSERGWTPGELDSMAASGFRFANLGDRILKTETAAVSAISVALARLGYL